METNRKDIIQFLTCVLLVLSGLIFLALCIGRKNNIDEHVMINWGIKNNYYIVDHERLENSIWPTSCDHNENMYLATIERLPIPEDRPESCTKFRSVFLICIDDRSITKAVETKSECIDKVLM